MFFKLKRIQIINKFYQGFGDFPNNNRKRSYVLRLHILPINYYIDCVGCWKLGRKKARFSINAQVVILSVLRKRVHNRGFFKMSRVRISKRGSGAWGIFFEGGGWEICYNI